MIFFLKDITYIVPTNFRWLNLSRNPSEIIVSNKFLTEKCIGIISLEKFDRDKWLMYRKNPQQKICGNNPLKNFSNYYWQIQFLGNKYWQTLNLSKIYTNKFVGEIYYEHSIRQVFFWRICFVELSSQRI